MITSRLLLVLFFFFFSNEKKMYLYIDDISRTKCSLYYNHYDPHCRAPKKNNEEEISNRKHMHVFVYECVCVCATAAETMNNNLRNESNRQRC